jgi:hypothetical protein
MFRALFRCQVYSCRRDSYCAENRVAGPLELVPVDVDQEVAGRGLTLAVLTDLCGPKPWKSMSAAERNKALLPVIRLPITTIWSAGCRWCRAFEVMRL